MLRAPTTRFFSAPRTRTALTVHMRLRCATGFRQLSAGAARDTRGTPQFPKHLPDRPRYSLTDDSIITFTANWVRPEPEFKLPPYNWRRLTYSGNTVHWWFWHILGIVALPLFLHWYLNRNHRLWAAYVLEQDDLMNISNQRAGADARIVEQEDVLSHQVEDIRRHIERVEKLKAQIEAEIQKTSAEHADLTLPIKLESASVRFDQLVAELARKQDERANLHRVTEIVDIPSKEKQRMPVWLNKDYQKSGSSPSTPEQS